MLASWCGLRYNGAMLEASEDLHKLIVQLAADYPKIRFRPGKKFTFRPPRTIIFAEGSKLELLHELGHARLEHDFYATDVERLKMERAAWEEAHKLCRQYGVEYDEEFVEEALDSYRDWLHRKSQCPKCGLTRYQTRDAKYHCPGCDL